MAAWPAAASAQALAFSLEPSVALDVADRVILGEGALGLRRVPAGERGEFASLAGEAEVFTDRAVDLSACLVGARDDEGSCPLNLGEACVFRGETFQDPKVVKTTCRKAEGSQKAVLDRFDGIMYRAQKEGWTVGKAKAELAERRRGARRQNTGKPLPCFERTGADKTRLTVHLDRVRDPAHATPEVLDGLLSVLRDLVREIESHARASAAGQAGG